MKEITAKRNEVSVNVNLPLRHCRQRSFGNYVCAFMMPPARGANRGFLRISSASLSARLPSLVTALV